VEDIPNLYFLGSVAGHRQGRRHLLGCDNHLKKRKCKLKLKKFTAPRKGAKKKFKVLLHQEF
jgi:hypothetical protein